MVSTHREVVARFGPTPPRAVLLDTPYGFQENAAEITQRAVEYFDHRVQLAIEAAGFLGPLAVDPGQHTPLAETAALSRLRTADLIFAGPGSPSYALSVWRSSLVPETLASKITQGGAVVFASAAALTLGRYSVPVYEIYKVGQAIHWLDGLDLLGAIGFPGACAVIPHFDNAEAAPTTRASAISASGGSRPWRRSCPKTAGCWASTSTPRSSSISTLARSA